jgi:hypothetical protein
LVGKPEDTGSHGRPMRRREDNIRIDLREIVWEGRCGLASSGSGEGRLAGSSEHGNERSVSIKRREFFDLLSDCRLPIKDSCSWN